MTEIPSAQSQEQLKPLPTIMVLGKNIGVDWTGERIRRTPGHLSEWGEIGADGGGIAIEDGLAEIVLFTITNTAGKEPLSQEEAEASQDTPGETPKPEAVYMSRRFQSNFPHLAERAFIQPYSWDTNTDAKEARKLIENGELDPENWVLATIGFHLNRAVMLFKKAGVKVYHEIPTEELMERRYPGAKQSITTSPLYKKEQRKERVVKLVQTLPFMTNFITGRTKKRME